ncbi:hypothetical protein BKA63DRAFT_523568 [Paraphoma chrysanthemicola]|nr:hypothetical protein BKA63DRAFT_523568 [Paraphoma chrysanthemicola]
MCHLCTKTSMAPLSEEQHPSQGPMSAADLRSFVARATAVNFKSASKWHRDTRRSELRSQLFWYGIDHGERMMLPTLEKLLRQAVEANECHEDAPRVVEFKRRKDDARRKKEVAWLNCETPGERARENLDRFMEYYFITDGEPDPAKTTEPLALYGYENRKAFHIRAGHVPGLATLSGGESPDRTLCVGWDRNAVWQLAGSIDNEVRQKMAKQLEHKWERVFEENRAVIANLPRKGRSKKGARPLSNREKLDKCIGSYVIRCEELSSGFDECESLSLDIASGPAAGILEGAVQLGIIKGTMLLAFDEDDLEEYVDAAEFAENTVYDEDRGRWVYPSKTKRKVGESSEGRPRKRFNTNTTTAHRLYFRLRGRETSEGLVLCDPKKGVLDFTDERFVTFKAVGSIEYVGSKVPFEGFKISQTPKTKAESWDSFSASAYGYGVVRRWH